MLCPLPTSRAPIQLLADLQRRRKELVEAKEALEEQKLLGAKVPAGQEKSVTKAPSLTEFDTGKKTVVEETLNSLDWKGFKKKDGEWAFLRDRDGRLRDELGSVKDFVEKLRKEKEVVVGGYMYRISEDRFLNRFPANRRPSR